MSNSNSNIAHTMTISEISTKYKVKGSAFRNVINYYNHQFGENAFQKDKELTEVLGGKTILPSSWLPASKYVQLEEKLANRFGLTLHEFCVECTTYILTTDLNGIYRFFIKVGGPERVMASVPRIAKVYNNLFLYYVISNSKGLHRLKFTTPSSVYEWASGSVEGGLRGILNVCGKPMITYEELDRRVFNDAGEDLMEGTFELTY